MFENTPISNEPSTYAEGVELTRFACGQLLQGDADSEHLVTLLIRGAVTAAFCDRVIFLKPNSSSAEKPQLDENGRADTRYLVAKSRSVETHTKEAQERLFSAIGGNEDSVKAAVERLVAECLAQTQVDWYQSEGDSNYQALTKRTLEKTRARLELWGPSAT